MLIITINYLLDRGLAMFVKKWRISYIQLEADTSHCPDIDTAVVFVLEHYFWGCVVEGSDGLD